MNEARFSITTRFNIAGFDSQLTVRDDNSLLVLLKFHDDAIKALLERGAIPERRWENNKGNGSQPAKQPAQPKTSECPDHHTSRLGRNGYYCPTKLENGEWCPWQAPAPTEWCPWQAPTPTARK